jgi:hypothetical protein
MVVPDAGFASSPAERKSSMSKKFRIRMIAWMLTAVMLFCGLSMSALATELDGDSQESYSEGTKPVSLVSGPAIINDLCEISYTFKTEGGEEIDLSKASGTGVLVLKVQDVNSKLPDASSFIYKLPSQVKTASDGHNDDVAWTFDESKKQLAFTWSGEKKSSFTANISVVIGGVYPLYNLADINGTWYRLAKTEIETEKPYSAHANGSVLGEAYYTAEDYNFVGLDIEINGTTYIYVGPESPLDLKNPVPYYTVQFSKIDIQHSKIGGADSKNNPRWLVPEGQRYDDAPTTGGYHRNFKITLHEAPVVEEQPLYNFLHIDKLWYRLRKTTVIARPISTYKAGERPKADQYTIPEEYDFSGLILEDSKGEKYRYSPVDLTGDYESYYTVTVEEELLVKNVMHGNASWYFNEDGWLDGSKATFTAEELASNNHWGFHRDYVVTLHKGKPITETKDENLKIVAESDWPEGKIAFVGAKITLTAKLYGFENKTYKLQWQHSEDGQNWTDQPGANEETYTYALDEQTAKYKWRVVARNIQDKK